MDTHKKNLKDSPWEKNVLWHGDWCDTPFWSQAPTEYEHLGNLEEPGHREIDRAYLDLCLDLMRRGYRVPYRFQRHG